jgi:hypothetical protein
VSGLPGRSTGADLFPMTTATEPAGIPAPRHRAPEEALPAPLGGPRHRAASADGGHLRVAAPEERSRPGRHAAPEDDEARATDEDPLAWLGFHFQTA